MSKLALLSAVAVAQDVMDGNMKPNDPKVIEMLNSQGATWVAGVNPALEGLTFNDVRGLLGTALSHISEHENNTLASYGAVSLPTEFDARSHWEGLLHPIRNQAQCGSCWAFSASEVLSDRFAIATRTSSPVLSAEDLVSCDKGDMGCNGGMLNTAWDYMTRSGIVTDDCYPYDAGSGHASTCATSCKNGDRFTKYFAKNSYALKGVSNVQADLVANGPVQTAFNVYKSFMSYKSGVYTKHFWEFLPEGGHAVKIVGYGTEAGQDYWLIANSWGPTWGLSGYFKIKRGGDECGIETRGPPYAGLPKINSVVV